MEIAYKRGLLSPSYVRYEQRMKVFSAICGTNSYPNEFNALLEEQKCRVACNELYREICQLRMKLIPGEPEEQELKEKIAEYEQKNVEYEAKKAKFEALLLNLEKTICVVYL